MIVVDVNVLYAEMDAGVDRCVDSRFRWKTDGVICG